MIAVSHWPSYDVRIGKKIAKKKKQKKDFVFGKRLAVVTGTFKISLRAYFLEL